MNEMSWEVTKDGVSVRADTQEELAIAIAALRDVADEKPVGSVHLPIAVNAPAWRVGGPPDDRIKLGDTTRDGGPADAFTRLRLDELEEDKPVLTLVTEPGDLLATPHITVSRKNREVLDAVALFPEGVSTGSLATLLGLKQVVVTSRIQSLKTAGLVQRIPNHRLWEATTLARRAKLVTG